MNQDTLDPFFLGPASENDQLLESLLLEFIRDHCYWRRNFHPADRPAISSAAQYGKDYVTTVAHMKDELHQLSADLKKAVPFFSPRYLGHMSSDILLPSFIARVVTTLYNPNNVSEDVAPATLTKELEVGLQLAQMFGMATDNDQSPCAWGHLTSGGTVANYEALWNLRAIKFYAIALAEADQQMGIDLGPIGPLAKKLGDYSKWELCNLSIDDAIALRRAYARHFTQNHDKKTVLKFARMIRVQRIESLGLAGFFRKHSDLQLPKLVVPCSAHYSWEKGMKVLGLGTAQMVKVPVDDHMRMDSSCLAELLDAEAAAKTPILGVVGILGTTEFGTVDPIHEIVSLRQKLRHEGLDFGIHVDAAWGGYLMSVFRNADGSLRSQQDIRKEFTNFPSNTVYQAFAALSKVDSITVDPHKLGYVPYAAGAFLCRNREITDFITQKAAYVFDLGEQEKDIPTQEKLRNLGKYVLEGSKSGAAAASVHLTHKVLPLHHEGFGRILKVTVRACEYFYKLVKEKRAALADRVRITIPFVTDSNLICLAINPVGNRSLAAMNRFSRSLFADMKVDPSQPVQTKEFIGSYTSLLHDNMPENQADRVLQELDLDPDTFKASVENP